jgi:hypothetical protein
MFQLIIVFKHILAEQTQLLVAIVARRLAHIVPLRGNNPESLFGIRRTAVPPYRRTAICRQVV